MDWLNRLRDLLPFGVRITAARRTMVRFHKINVAELEECKPKGFLRERPFWRTDKLDFYHLLPDGTINHTPGD